MADKVKRFFAPRPAPELTSSAGSISPPSHGYGQVRKHRSLSQIITTRGDTEIAAVKRVTDDSTISKPASVPRSVATGGDDDDDDASSSNSGGLFEHLLTDGSSRDASNSNSSPADNDKSSESSTNSDGDGSPHLNQLKAIMEVTEIKLVGPQYGGKLPPPIRIRRNANFIGSPTKSASITSSSSSNSSGGSHRHVRLACSAPERCHNQ